MEAASFRCIDVCRYRHDANSDEKAAGMCDRRDATCEFTSHSVIVYWLIYVAMPNTMPTIRTPSTIRTCVMMMVMLVCRSRFATDMM